MKHKYMATIAVDGNEQNALRANGIVDKNGGESLGWRKSNSGQLQIGFVAEPKAATEIEVCLGVIRFKAEVKDFGEDDGKRKAKPAAPTPAPVPAPAPAPAPEAKDENPAPKKRKAKAAPAPEPVADEGDGEDKPVLQTCAEIASHRPHEEDKGVIEACNLLKGTPREWCDPVCQHFGYFAIDRMKLYMFLGTRIPNIGSRFPKGNGSWSPPVLTYINLLPFVNEAFGQDAEKILRYV